MATPRQSKDVNDATGARTSDVEGPAAPRAPRPKASRRSQRARTAILTAALEQARTLGYARMSIEGIAAAAGVGKQTIYRWWPSKAAVVFDAILDQNTQDGGEVVLPDSGDLEADLSSLIRATVAELADVSTDRLQRALVAEIQTDLDVASDLVRRLLRPQMDATVARIESAIAAGQASESVPAEIVVELIFGPILHRWLLRTGELGDAYADQLTGAVLRAVRP
jgi:AcrR family transcriptional regulator